MATTASVTSQVKSHRHHLPGHHACQPVTACTTVGSAVCLPVQLFLLVSTFSSPPSAMERVQRIAAHFEGAPGFQQHQVAVGLCRPRCYVVSIVTASQAQKGDTLVLQVSMQPTAGFSPNFKVAVLGEAAAVERQL